ncbi:hypothetical protein Hamer_G003389, partial [Homarus americanus]
VTNISQPPSLCVPWCLLLCFLQEVEDHVQGHGDLRALTEARGWEVARPERRVVHESARKWGTVDTEDVHETSRVQDGHVVTETERTTQHEQYENESLPDSGSSLSDGSVHEEARETQHNIVHTKDEDLVEYYGVPRGGTLAQGLGEGMHVVSEDFHEDREGEDLDSLSERLRRARRLGALKPKPRDAQERTDALTRRPLDYHQEEETRKSETNRWLENHFGSESGRSGSSHQDPEEEGGGLHTAGGNVITITMSPRPATPEDQPDVAPPSIHRWGNSPMTTNHTLASKAPPPPPPPKPAAAWMPPPPATSSHQQSPPSEEITHTMIAAARAKLRSTGRILDDGENGTPPTSPPATNGVRFTSLQDRTQVLPPSSGTFASPPMSPTGVSRPPDDPVYSSRFRSGSPAGFVPTRVFSTPGKMSRPPADSPPDSPPPPLPATPPPPPSNNVGRSQSFNVTAKNWMNGGSRTSSSRLMDTRMKEYRSEEQLDTVGHRPSRQWPPTHREVSPEPQRETTPPPPPRQRSSLSPHTHYNTTPTRSSRPSRISDFVTQTIARDSGTQTESSPVPPPRTKRKSKPKTYYFGQDSSSSTSSSHKATRTPNTTTTTASSYTRTSTHNQMSPKVERKFRTTKTITPVIVPKTTTTASSTNHNSSMKNRSWHYRSMDELSTGVDSTPRASWTNTVDPRRRPRDYSHQAKEPEMRTLPKKLVNGTLSPSKTYIFGGDNTSNGSRVRSESSSHLRRSHGGSMVNVSLAGMSSPKSKAVVEPQDRQSPPRDIRPVIRSQSLNVKPAPLSVPPSTVSPSVGLSSHQRTSSVYKSSPYLNLRSPNLIATIARSNSTRRSDEDHNGNHEREESPPPAERYRSPRQVSGSSSRRASLTPTHNHSNAPVMNGQDSREEEKRNRFMKGLLTSAPELFHFIHGDEVDKPGNDNAPSRTRQPSNPPESPPQLIRPPESPLTSPTVTSPPASAAPRIFTFGRGETGSLKRSPSLLQENNNNNRFSSLGRPRESLSSSHRDNNISSSQRETTTTNQRNSLSSQYHRNALLNQNGTNSLSRPKFNLKSSGDGSSILYSTSFRNRQEPNTTSLNRRGSDSYDPPPQSRRWREQEDAVEGKSGGKVTSNITRDGAVLIPIRDWNSR